ncbi:LysM peptidoglycan-binding domain-containing protein [Aminiphilus sp.]|uniref:LysM peptidoglycan-binding domain-containing protein n=1 Tax=Aminiphilus sp. TaxID=1872488 RepID=UPI002627247E|nr:LysM peptidoglycan-binding domain-containing protein [Aminiphilus sp.]
MFRKSRERDDDIMLSRAYRVRDEWRSTFKSIVLLGAVIGVLSFAILSLHPKAELPAKLSGTLSPAAPTEAPFPKDPAAQPLEAAHPGGEGASVTAGGSDTPAGATSTEGAVAVPVGSGTSAAAPTRAPSPQTFREHTVAAGESLSVIARRYGTTVQALADANGLKSPYPIRIGQVLRVPVAAGNASAPTAAIAAGTGASPETARPVHTETPAQAPATGGSGAPATARPGAPRTSVHTVAAGETLWSIATKYGVTVATVLGSNALADPNRLQPGMQLRVPDRNGLFHTVKSGESLNAIASRYGVAAAAIAEANPGLQGETVVAGSELFIPGAKP